METVSEPIPQQSTSADTWSPHDASLVRRGPFYNAQKTVRLVTPERWNLGRRIALGIILGWAPLFLITMFTKPGTLLDLLKDYSVNVRMLVGVPVLLFGQILMENFFRMIFRHIQAANLLTSSDEAKLNLTIAKLVRISDSIVAEALLVALAYLRIVTVIGTHKGFVEPWALSQSGAPFALSPAGWYYALASQLLYQFLLALSLWKWILWICFVFRLSRLDLQLVPTHPDKHGGLGFLGMSPLAITCTVFVSSAAIGSTWRVEILKQGQHLMDFKIVAAVFFLIVFLVAMGPLLLFVPRLSELRRQGVLQYGILGQLHSVDFHKKWILNREGHEEEFLTAPEISTLTDYGTSYENVEKLQPFPFDRSAAVMVALAVAVPLFPVILAEVPFITVLKELLSALK